MRRNDYAPRNNGRLHVQYELRHRCLEYVGLCDVEVLLACGDACLLALSLLIAEGQIALSLHTSQPQLSEYMLTGRRIRRYERRVAFDTHTDTLLLGMEYNDHSDQRIILSQYVRTGSWCHYAATGASGPKYNASRQL